MGKGVAQGVLGIFLGGCSPIEDVGDSLSRSKILCDGLRVDLRREREGITKIGEQIYSKRSIQRLI